MSTQDPRSGAPGEGGREPSEEELRAALEEQMRRITVEDVLLQTVVTLVNLTGRRLGLAPPPDETGGAGPGGEAPPAEKDVAQARLGIEAVRALLPLCPADQTAPIRDALSQLQMVFAREAQGAAGAAPAGAAPAPGQATTPATGERQPAGDRDKVADEAERAKARSKIWTPPGS